MMNSQDFGATGMSESYGGMATGSSFADLEGHGGDVLGQSFASTFRNRGTAMTTEELRKARESRAAEALKMKDEQLRILTEQNASLMKTLNKVSHAADTAGPVRRFLTITGACSSRRRRTRFSSRRSPSNRRTERCGTPISSCRARRSRRRPSPSECRWRWPTKTSSSES